MKQWWIKPFTILLRCSYFNLGATTPTTNQIDSFAILPHIKIRYRDASLRGVEGSS